VKVYSKFLDVLQKILMGICGILLLIMVLAICYQVILRYCFHNANIWAEELSRYSMEWIVMLACPIAFRRHRHTRVDYFVEKLPKKLVPFLQLILYILILWFLGTIGITGIRLAAKGAKQLSPGLFIPMSWIYSAQVVGPILMYLYLFECIIKECIIPIWHIVKGDEV